jgi:hypothetical protein
MFIAQRDSAVTARKSYEKIRVLAEGCYPFATGIEPAKLLSVKLGRVR